VSKKKPKTIDASCPVTLMGCEGEVIVEMTPTEAVSMLEKAWQENKRLRQENATITAERDEARRMWCEAEAVGNCLSVDDMYRRARTEAKRREWDCYKEDGK
jgi:hypothetical protein